MFGIKMRFKKKHLKRKIYIIVYDAQLCYNYEKEKELRIMPLIMPIKDLRNTTEISNIAHKEQEPIFITKNGYSDLVVMSSELYDKFARINRIDQAIYESEQEVINGAEAVDADVVFAELEKKHFG